MKTKTKEIEEALRFLLESCDEIEVEAHSTKVKIIKEGYSVGVMKKGRFDYEYEITNNLSEVAEKIESGNF